MPITLSRRRVIAFGVGGAALLGAGAALRHFAFGYEVPPGTVSLALSTKERAIVRALVDTIAPGTAEVASGLALGVDERVDEELWAAPLAVRQDLTDALHLIEHAPPFLGVMGRFTAQDRATRARLFTSLLTSDRDVMVQAAVAYKQIVQLYTYTRPTLWPHIGYDGPWIPVEKPPPSHLAYREALAAARRRDGGRENGSAT